MGESKSRTQREVSPPASISSSKAWAKKGTKPKNGRSKAAAAAAVTIAAAAAAATAAAGTTEPTKTKATEKLLDRSDGTEKQKGVKDKINDERTGMEKLAFLQSQNLAYQYVTNLRPEVPFRGEGEMDFEQFY